VSYATSYSNHRPEMWDDEDNNPYGSFNRRNSEESDVPGM